MVEEEFEDRVEFIDHFCYAIDVERSLYVRCVVIIYTPCLGGQIRKVVAPLFGSVVVFVFVRRFLPDDSIEWIKVENLCLFLPRLKFLKLDLYLYLWFYERLLLSRGKNTHIYLNRSIDDRRH